MAAKTCQICGAPSGMYPLCPKCFKLRDNGSVIQCEKCKRWHIVNNKCACKPKGIVDTLKNVFLNKPAPQAPPQFNKPTNTANNKKPTPIQPGEYVYNNIKMFADEFDYMDYRKKNPADYRCNNGLYVRSEGERTLANWLYDNKIQFEYERLLPFAEPVKQYTADFYLPDYRLHIEYYEKNNFKGYDMRRQNKEILYQHYNLRRVYVTKQTSKNVGDFMAMYLNQLNNPR